MIEILHIPTQRILPDWSDLSFGQALDDKSTLNFTYPYKLMKDRFGHLVGRNADLLEHGETFQVRINGKEPYDARFRLDETSVSLMDNQKITLNFSCWKDRLADLYLNVAVGSNVVDDKAFSYKDRTIGWILQTFLTNALTRAGNQSSWLDWSSFNDSFDSNGNRWGFTIDYDGKAGTSISEFLDWAEKLGFIEFWFQGNKLMVIDRTVGYRTPSKKDSVVLRKVLQLTELTEDIKSSDLVNSVIVLGDNSTCTWVQDKDSIAKYGYREGKWSISNASVISTLDAAGKAYLRFNAYPKESRTYTMSAHPRVDKLGKPLHDKQAYPFIDFQCGDRITIDVDGDKAPHLVHLITATWKSSESASYTVTFDNWFNVSKQEFDWNLGRLGLGK